MGSRRAANLATVGFAGLAVFQAALAGGAPLGYAAWGGSHDHLATAQRVGSAVSLGFYGAAILVVRRRAAGRSERRYRWSTWAVAVALAASGLVNIASASPWERYVLAPLALFLAAMTLVVARSSSSG